MAFNGNQRAPCLYRTRRLPSDTDYYAVPHVDTTLVQQVPLPPSYLHRIFYIGTKKYCAWSPNSTQLPFYPGSGAVPPSRDIPAQSARRLDGHLGPKDPTRNPQLYVVGRPWLPLIEKRDENDIEPDVSYEDVFDVWTTDNRDGIWGSIDRGFITRLTSAHRTVTTRIRHCKMAMPHTAEDHIYLIHDEDLTALNKIQHFDEAVDAVKSIQRCLLEQRAWIRYVEAYPYGRRPPEDLQREIQELKRRGIQPADDGLIGLWLNGAEIPPLRFWWFLNKAKVPCFILDEVGDVPWTIHPQTSPVLATDIQSLMDRAPYDHLAILPACTLLRRPGVFQDADTVIARNGLRGDKLQCIIEERGRLNDLVVNQGIEFCRADLVERSPAIAAEFHLFNTYFLELFESKGYTGRKKLLKHFQLSDKKWLLLPIHMVDPYEHWLLALFYLAREFLSSSCSDPIKSIHLFLLNSVARSEPTVEKRLSDCLKQIFRVKLPSVDFDSLRKQPVWIKNIPHQYNSWDCGFYLLHYLACILRAPLYYLENFMKPEGAPCNWLKQNIDGAREALLRRISDLVDEYDRVPIQIESDSDSEGESVAEMEIAAADEGNHVGAMEVDQCAPELPASQPDSMDVQSHPAPQPDLESGTPHAGTDVPDEAVPPAIEPLDGPHALALDLQNDIEMVSEEESSELWISESSRPPMKVEWGWYVCSACRDATERSARRVAAVIPEQDRSMVNDLESRVDSKEENNWHLNQECNVPECWARQPLGGDCAISRRYLHHLQAACLGFTSDEAYAEHERATARRENPPLILPDEDIEMSNVAVEEGQAIVEDASDTAQDAQLTEHMKKLKFLQGVRGRQVMNVFMHDDSAAQKRLEGVCDLLDAQLRLKTEQRDVAESRLEALATELQEVERQLAESQAGFNAQREQLQSRIVQMGHELEAQQRQPLPVANSQSPLTRSASGSGLSLRTTPLIFWDLSAAGLARLSDRQLRELRATLLGMRQPGYDDPPEIFARWLQVHGDNQIMGVPLSQPNSIVDLRDVRGRNRVLSLIPTKGKESRLRHQSRLWRITSLLGMPGAYGKLLVDCKVEVTQAPRAAVELGDEAETPDAVARFLASRGVTIAEADDAWQFIVNLVREGAKKNREDYLSLLREIQNKVEVVGKPVGLRTREQDQLASFDALMGILQEGERWAPPPDIVRAQVQSLMNGTRPQGRADTVAPGPGILQGARDRVRRLLHGTGSQGGLDRPPSAVARGRGGRQDRPQSDHDSGPMRGRSPERDERRDRYYTAPWNFARSSDRSRSPRGYDSRGDQRRYR
ncbi:hypothetical protein B0H16DRAFT_1570311 [Mycena metata]|uniref:Ubiquitin-like protease family profile domain-containing protein n=1 Tax=Mycena metata TaxID=1033252 RepID=A0AAD7IBQ2_9AGAR|nr:hypothetical protein B0H16DRAFT_1570311 [Mycena metata]